MNEKLGELSEGAVEETVEKLKIRGVTIGVVPKMSEQERQARIDEAKARLMGAGGTGAPVDGVTQALDDLAARDRAPHDANRDAAKALKDAAEELHFAAGSMQDAGKWRVAKHLEDMEREVRMLLELHGE